MSEPQSPSLRPPLYSVQALRGLAALMVLLSHLPVMEIKYSPDQILPDFLRFGIAGVDLFFVISGFIMVYVSAGTGGSARDAARFLFARITRIYPLYWLIAGAVLLVWSRFPSLVNFSEGRPNLIKSFLLWPDHTLPFLKVAWTLIHEMYFYLVFGALLILPRRLLLPGLCLWIIGVIAGYMTGYGKLSPETALIFHPLSVEFFLGAMAGFLFLHRPFSRAGARTTWIIGGAMLIIAVITLTRLLPADSYPEGFGRVLVFGLPAVLIVFGAACLEAAGSGPLQRLKALGDQSYSLYLSHVLTLSAVGILWSRFAVTGIWDNLLICALMILVSVGVSWALWRGFEKPVLAYFKRLRARLF